jgi:hypothetical protein
LPELLAELGNRHPQFGDALSWLAWLIDQWRALPEGTGILLGFVVLWFMLRRERKRLGERIETLRQIMTAVSDQSEEQEAVLAQAQVQAQPDASLQTPLSGGVANTVPIRDELANWNTVRAIWRDVRDRLELLIEDISSSRVRSKYSKMPRRRYRDIINALERDRELTAKVADTLLSMEGVFNRARFKPRGVADSDVHATVDVSGGTGRASVTAAAAGISLAGLAADWRQSPPSLGSRPWGASWLSTSSNEWGATRRRSSSAAW